MTPRLALGLLLLPLAFLPNSPAPPTAVERLLSGMANRLQVQHAVARWKWVHSRPIEDAPRERELLARLRARASAHGVPPAEAEEFFAAQIEAGKQIQRADHARFAAERRPRAGSTIPLGRLRECLDRLGEILLKELGEARPWLASSGHRADLPELARERLAGPGIDDGVREAAVAPLLVPPALWRP